MGEGIIIAFLQLLGAIAASVIAWAVVGTWLAAKQIAEHTAALRKHAERSEITLTTIEQRLGKLEAHAEYQSSLMGSG